MAELPSNPEKRQPFGGLSKLRLSI